MGVVRILVDVGDGGGVEERGAALDAMHLIAFGEEQLGEVGSVLAGDAGDEGFLQWFQSPWRFYFRVQIDLVPLPIFAQSIHSLTFSLGSQSQSIHCKWVIRKVFIRLYLDASIFLVLLVSILVAALI